MLRLWIITVNWSVKLIFIWSKFPILYIYRHFSFLIVLIQFDSCLPVGAAVHCSGVLMGRRMRMKILLRMLVQLRMLCVPFHLCGGDGGPGTGRCRLGRVEAAGSRRLRLGRRRWRRDSRGWRLCRALFDVVVLAQDAIVMQVEPVSDTKPKTHTELNQHRVPMTSDQCQWPMQNHLSELFTVRYFTVFLLFSIYLLCFYIIWLPLVGE